MPAPAGQTQEGELLGPLLKLQDKDFPFVLTLSPALAGRSHHEAAAFRLAGSGRPRPQAARSRKPAGRGQQEGARRLLARPALAADSGEQATAEGRVTAAVQHLPDRQTGVSSQGPLAIARLTKPR